MREPNNLKNIDTTKREFGNIDEQHEKILKNTRVISFLQKKNHFFSLNVFSSLADRSDHDAYKRNKATYLNIETFFGYFVSSAEN